MQSIAKKTSFAYNLIVYNKPLAAIDIGTNTFRLLIAEVQSDRDKHTYSFKEICSKRTITRLGETIHKDGILNKEAMDRGIAALKTFSDIIARHNVSSISAAATSALRNAGNSIEFIRRAKEETGIAVEVITGEEEAGLTASGILSDIAMPETSLMIDIGGGSTELIFTRGVEPLVVQSLDLGVVYEESRYMRNDPPSDNDLHEMNDDVSRKIMNAAGPFKKLISTETVLIGTAGTVTALAAMAQRLDRYEHSKIHNFKLTIEEVKNIFSRISTATSMERAKHIPFEPARLDIIVPGTLILFRLMEIFGFSELTVSNHGLREGILIDLYNKKLRSHK